MNPTQLWKGSSGWWKIFFIVFAVVLLIVIFIIIDVTVSYNGSCTGPLTSIGSYPSECTFWKYLSNNTPTVTGIELYVLAYLFHLFGFPV